MLKIEDYVQLDYLQQYEFGLALSVQGGSPAIQIIVVDHKLCKVRTLASTRSLEAAFGIAQGCIQKGFYVNGLSFPGIPGYSFSPTTNFASVR